MLDTAPAVQQRALQNTGYTASVTYYDDGVIVDPGTTTVKVEREDGTVLVAALTATGGAGAAARTYGLTIANTALLDRLKFTWTSASKGTLTTYVEVVGGFLFTVTDARADSTLSDATAYPVAAIQSARIAAEMALEEACSVAFVPRYHRDKYDGPGTYDLLLDVVRPLSIQSASIGGTAIVTSDLELYRDGRLYYPSGWTRGRRNVEVKLSHGYAVPPPRTGGAALKLAKWFLVESPLSDRATSIVNEDGTQFIVQAGVRDAIFSIPECNAVVDNYGVAGADVA